MHIPLASPTAFRATSELRLRVLSDPAGFVEMVREAGVPAPRRELPPAGAPDFRASKAACARYHIKLLGPLPE